MSESSEHKDLPDPQIFELSRTLQEFAASSRYSFLKTLQVGRFLKIKPDEAPLGVVEEMTFEKLIELGSKKLAKLRWLNPEQTLTLIKLLRSLIDDQGVTSNTPEVPSEVESSSDNTSDLPQESEFRVWNSADAENKLREILKDLKSTGKLALVSSKQLGSFWEPHWPRSPFEEAMTIGQLSEMDIATLLKKRTLSATRVGCIIMALSKSLVDVVEETEAKNSEGESPPQNLIQFTSPPANQPLQVSRLSGAPPSIAALATLLSAEHRTLSSPKNEFGRLCFELSEELSAHQLALIVHSMELKGESVARIQVEPERLSLVVRGLIDQVQEDIFERHGHILDLWREILKSPGATLQTLQQGFNIPGISEAVNAAWCLVVLRLLNASPVNVLGKIVDGAWTIDDGWVKATNSFLKKALPASAKELESILQALYSGPRAEIMRQAVWNRLVRRNGRWGLK